MLTVDADHLGTSEGEWQRSGRLASGAPLELRTWRRVVVAAPHPDDEVLGAGGLLQDLEGRGLPISIIAVTDGEGSHPRSPAAALIDLRSCRAAERTAALHRLLRRPAPVSRLGLPDGGVRNHEDAVRAALLDALSPGDLCVAPWVRDGHPDHDATGRAAIAAAGERGCDVLGYVIWAWHWARPDGGDIPWARCRQLRMSPRAAARKRWATNAYRSQIRPLGAHPDDAAVLPEAVLRRSWRRNETFVVGGGT